MGICFIVVLFGGVEAAPPFLWGAIAENPYAYLKPTSIPLDVVFDEDGALGRTSLCQLYTHVFEGQGLESPPFGFLSREEILQCMFSPATHWQVH